jgi:hypothetical protein
VSSRTHGSRPRAFHKERSNLTSIKTPLFRPKIKEKGGTFL